MKLTHSLARYGHHDKSCPLHDEAIMPDDERCTCGLSRVAAMPDEILVRGIEAAEGALVLCNLYFDEQNRDPYNNDNYCRLQDWLAEAKLSLK